MYYAVLKIDNKEKNISLSLDLGLYSRPSTAERLRKQFADNNKTYVFTLILEAYDAGNETKSS